MKTVVQIVILSGLSLIGLVGFLKFISTGVKGKRRIILKNRSWTQHPYLTFIVGIPWIASLYLSFREKGKIGIPILAGLICSTAGILIFLLSICLWIWSLIWLGKGFSFQVEIMEGQELVASGPYGYVRHPMYASFILMNVGIALGMLNIIHLIFTIFVLFPVLYIRAKNEEGLLCIYFGDIYREYMLKTPMFFPWRVFKKGQ